MSVPIKPARNPRWESPAGEPPVVDLSAIDRAAVDADAADDRSYDEDVAKILTEIQSVTAVAELEARVAELEHDLSRIRSGHVEDAGRLSGELSIMKARIDDALGAVSATVADLQAAGLKAETPLEPVSPAGGGD